MGPRHSSTVVDNDAVDRSKFLTTALTWASSTTQQCDMFHHNTLHVTDMVTHSVGSPLVGEGCRRRELEMKLKQTGGVPYGSKVAGRPPAGQPPGGDPRIMGFHSQTARMSAKGTTSFCLRFLICKPGGMTPPPASLGLFAKNKCLLSSKSTILSHGTQ